MFPTEMSTAFTAQLMYISSSGELEPVMMIGQTEGNYWTGVSLADTGWLCLPEQSKRHTAVPLSLRFDFIEQTDDRTHFRISCATDFKGYRGTHLNTSSNGFLGLYQAFAPEAFWKTEEVAVFAGFGDLRPAFHLRDHMGMLVRKKFEDGIRYLVAGGETKPLVFTLDDYRQV